MPPLIKGPLVDYAYVIDEEGFYDGEEIVHEGAHGNWIWVILEGAAEIIKQTPNGPLRLLRVGDGGRVYLRLCRAAFREFKAVSVGAGISDWYTYHISNDIPDFTRDYLSGSPFRDRTLYERTAPMSNLSKAKTPMLIQHGSEDRRVPLSNATVLYRGLKEMGVPVELFIYPGMAHPITRPRENHAVMAQNLSWFCHYLLDEELKLA